jgi:steroid 5-alpha reductase family enzyme
VIFFIAIAVIFFHMSLIWLWYRHTKNPSVVDVGWASGLTIIGILYLYTSPISTKKIVLSLVLLIWGFRLGGYLWHTRIRLNLQDKRYDQLSKKWKMSKPLGFLLNFQFQGLLIGIVSLPWYFVSQLSPEDPLSMIDDILILIALFSIATESLADFQLQSFKTRHVGKVCDVGLWFYSRHPNYFFEWLTWCTFAGFAFPSPLGWLAWGSPLALLIIMTRITAPLTEKGSIESRGELYLVYQKSTPMFFPNVLKKKIIKISLDE